jgi:hypothetical protein
LGQITIWSETNLKQGEYKMANQKHLELLKRSVLEWNQWREQHQEIHIDLSYADLNSATLNRALMI